MRRLAPPAAVALLLLAGCGGGSETTTLPGNDDTTTTTSQAATSVSSDTSRIDPCLLLSTADLESATGLGFGAGTYNAALSQDELWICDWVVSGTEFATAQVLIVPSAAAFRGNLESAADALGGVDGLDVPGADDAYATGDGSIVGMLIDDRFVQVAFIGSGPGDGGDATVELATIVAANLST